MTNWNRALSRCAAIAIAILLGACAIESHERRRDWVVFGFSDPDRPDGYGFTRVCEPNVDALVLHSEIGSVRVFGIIDDNRSSLSYIVGFDDGGCGLSFVSRHDATHFTYGLYTVEECFSPCSVSEEAQAVEVIESYCASQGESVSVDCRSFLGRSVDSEFILPVRGLGARFQAHRKMPAFLVIGEGYLFETYITGYTNDSL